MTDTDAHPAQRLLDAMKRGDAKAIPAEFVPGPEIARRASEPNNDTRPWRTNIGLRLALDLGEWFERQCEAENRTFANYVETLIMRERARIDPGRPVPHHGSGPAEQH